MQIKQLLASGRTFSFEFSVPRTAKAEARLRRTVAELAPINPSFVSVTYGAAGSSREQTRETVLWLLRDARLTTMPHLTCIAQSRQEVIDILTEYREAGFGNLLALHGDPPRDNPGIEEGDFHYAIELVELARELTEFSIGVATHPEGHPAAPDTVSDREHQAAKLRVADFGITQFSFEAKYYLRLMDDMAARGVDTPIIAGVIPVTNVNEVKRFADLAGASFPPTSSTACERSRTTSMRCAGSGWSRRPSCAGGCWTRACRASTCTRSTGRPPHARYSGTSRIGAA